MALDKPTLKQRFPIPTYNYRVRIGSEVYPFSEVSGLSIDFEPVSYKHGLSYLEGAEQIAGMRGETRLTLKRGIVPRRSDLLDWLRPTGQGKAEKHDLWIDLCDETGEPVITWQVMQAFPVKLEGPALTADANEVAIESIELLVHHLNLIYHH